MNYVISLGSNREDGSRMLDWALRCLSESCRLLRLSPFYITPAMGGGLRPYFNAVAVVESDCDYDALNAKCKEIELHQGRDDDARSRGDVPVDMDIVIAGDCIMRPADYRQEFFRIGMDLLVLHK